MSQSLNEFFNQVTAPRNLDTPERQLIAAARDGDAARVGALIKQNVNIFANTEEAFRLATKNGHQNVLTLLKAAGSLGLSAQLIAASGAGDAAKVAELIKQGANVLVDGEAPLLRAAWHGHLEVVKLLTAEGSRGIYSYSLPTMIAEWRGHHAVAHHLRHAPSEPKKGFDLAWRNGRYIPVKHRVQETVNTRKSGGPQ